STTARSGTAPNGAAARRAFRSCSLFTRRPGSLHGSPPSATAHIPELATTSRRPSWIGDAVEMTSPPAAPSRRIVRLVGVYDADGTLRGELSYWVGARLGRRHCSLCAITHGSVRERSERKSCKAGLPIPFDTYHRNDQPEAIRSAAGGLLPTVIAETDTGHVV